MKSSPPLMPLLNLPFIFKGMLLWCCLSFGVIVAMCQSESSIDDVVITFSNEKTLVTINEDGKLQVNVSPQNVQVFKTRGWIAYSDFGARGDGKTDDIDAIAGTHAFVNQYNSR